MEKKFEEEEVGLRERRFEDSGSGTEDVDSKAEYPEPKGIILNDKQVRDMRKYVDQAILSTHKKLKHQFWNFLRCTPAAEIARKANCSRENIHKNFQKAIKKILTQMGGNLSISDLPSKMTPKKFKDYVIVVKY
jgi:hypothetical protein